MVVRYHLLLFAFIVPLTTSTSNIKDFFKTTMRQPVIITFSNPTNLPAILSVDVPKILLNFGQNYTEFNIDKSFGYILAIEDYDSLQAVLKILITFKNWNSRQKYLIIFQKPISPQTIEQSFQLLFKKYIYNCVIYNDNIFYTWYPYSEQNKCGTLTTLVKVNFTKMNPYLNKIPRKFNRCPVNVTWSKTNIFLWNPFTNIYPGALFLLFNTVAKKMNITVKYLRNNTNFFESYVQTGNFNVLLQDMEQRNIDLVLYGAINGDIFHKLENSHRIYQIEYYFILPPQKKLLLQNYIVNMYSTNLLCGVVTALTASCILWKFLAKKSMTDSIFDTFQLAVQLSLSKIPTRNSMKIYFITVVIFSMSINAAFQTKLSSVVTKPSYESKITSIAQLLLNSDVRITAFNNTLRTLYGENKLKAALQAKWKIFPTHLRTVDLIERFIQNQSETVAISRVHMHHFKNPEKLHMINKEPVNALLQFVAAKKGFPLMALINHWIDILIESGITEKYLRDTTSVLRKFVVKNFARDLDFDELDLVRLEGAFVIYSAGIALSCIVFLTEILTVYFVRRS